MLAGVVENFSTHVEMVQKLLARIFFFAVSFVCVVGP